MACRWPRSTASFPAARWIPASICRPSSWPCSSAGASATCSRSRCVPARARPRWVFYEGPPTANGPPGIHHVLSRVFKDIYPRYKTMRGHRVERKGGWDCHGLPVEIAVEQELGIGTKAEIEAYGIAEFNARCRAAVFTYLEDWDRLTERIGFWLDLEHAYRTLDGDYIESVWWALAQIHGKGLLYEGHKVVPYCPRCGTALSSHEVALGYRDVEDPSVYVRLPVRATADARCPSRCRRATSCSCGRRRRGRSSRNAAVAVDAELDLRAGASRRGVGVRARRGARGARARRETPRCWTGSPGRRSPGRRTSRRSPSSRVTSTVRAGTRCCSPTSSRPATAPASCTRRSPSARTTSASASATA